MNSREMPLFVYRARVEALAAKRNGEPLYNDSLEHAAIILQSMFSHARHSVKLLTGELNKDAYARRAILNEVERFVKDEGHSLHMLYEDEKLATGGTETRHPFLEAIANNKNVEIRHVPRQLQSRYACHFMLVDDDSYRFEPDKEKFEAVAAFGDEEGGKNIGEFFATLWEKAEADHGTL